MNSDTPILLALGSVIAVAAASGFVGVFALMRRMTLAADAMSHVALPGLAVAILAKVNPLLGGALALILGALVVWWLERSTRIPSEAIIGVLFSASLAIGGLLAMDHELLEALFGDFGSIAPLEAWIGIVVSLTAAALLFFFKERFTLAFVSPDLARTSGLHVDRLSLAFLLSFAVVIILGLKFLGALLMGSLVIVPAAAARNFTRSLAANLTASVGIAIVSVVGGFFLADAFGKELGPMAISTAAAIFFASLFFRK